VTSGTYALSSQKVLAASHDVKPLVFAETGELHPAMFAYNLILHCLIHGSAVLQQSMEAELCVVDGLASEITPVQ
jgi:hypothetical protein